jgi:hypothetical protein
MMQNRGKTIDRRANNYRQDVQFVCNRRYRADRRLNNIQAEWIAVDNVRVHLLTRLVFRPRLNSGCTAPGRPDSAGKQCLRHRYVRYGSHSERLPESLKTCAAVEPGDFQLGVDVYPPQPPVLRTALQPVKELTADTSATPFTQYGHPADTPVSQQPSGCDGFIRSCNCQHMAAVCIPAVPFEIFRNALFLHEDVPADAADGSRVALPGGLDNKTCRCFAHGSAAWS